MVTLDLADALTLRPTATGLEVDGPSAAGVPLDDDQPRRARALRLVGRTAARPTSTSAIPAGGGLGGGSADAAAVLRWAGCDDLVAGRRASAPTSRSASSAAGPG